VDLEFVCKDGSVFCHKLVVAAHSNFLKNLLIANDSDNDSEKVCCLKES
jgi:hypothetical protein